ncbi:double-stranded RNA-specific adenosine deaminase-like [Siphateles boraxobius]|uniref:double-stranded RNA-specific adenosine deaminase-like n=1 Tax=Siphateles boraxobius TaxID=180520 RepID=UPI00406314E9
MDQHPIATIYSVGQRTGQEVAFIREGQTGPPHSRVCERGAERFTVRVRLGLEEFPEGSGSNKRAAREAAARKALRELRRRGSLPERRLREGPRLQDCLNRQSLSGLRYYAAAHGEELEVVLVEQTGPPNSQRFTYQVKLGGRSFLPMSGSSKKQAREKAAHAAVAILLEENSQNFLHPLGHGAMTSCRLSPWADGWDGVEMSLDAMAPCGLTILWPYQDQMVDLHLDTTTTHVVSWIRAVYIRWKTSTCPMGVSRAMKSTLIP